MDRSENVKKKFAWYSGVRNRAQFLMVVLEGGAKLTNETACEVLLGGRPQLSSEEGLRDLVGSRTPLSVVNLQHN